MKGIALLGMAASGWLLYRAGSQHDVLFTVLAGLALALNLGVYLTSGRSRR